MGFLLLSAMLLVAAGPRCFWLCAQCEPWDVWRSQHLRHFLGDGFACHAQVPVFDGVAAGLGALYSLSALHVSTW
jgi:hypothetical protein